MSDIPERIINLSPAKLALLNRRLKSQAAPDTQTIKRRERADGPSGAPLSFAQQRLWFLSQLQPDSAAYNIPGAVRLAGPLDVDALERTLNEIMRRHEALRTRFAAGDQEPLQVVDDEQTCALPVEDLSWLPPEEREEEARRLAVAEARQPFDLARSPMLRARLLRLQPDEHVLLFTMHHIASDAWSMGVLVSEVGQLYAAFSEGSPSPLAELPVQYADYAVWQRERLQGAALDEQLSFWREQLEGAPAALDLPTDYTRPPEPDTRGASQRLTLPRELSARLRELSRREGCTPFMTLLTAFKILLSRHTGQTDVVVGTPVTGRRMKELEGLIGFFINTLALRTDLSGTLSFRQLLGRVRETTLKAQDHSELPFEKLVEELQPERRMNRHPLFEVLFNFLNQPLESLRLPGLILSYPRLTEPDAKFAMTLYAHEQGEDLTLNLVYQQALFSPARIGHLLRQYEHLLEQATDAPDLPVDTYSLVTEEARALLPDPTVELPEPRHEPAHMQFLTQAKIHPQQIAVSQSGRNWSYQELAQSATSIAQELLASGQRRGEIVAVTGGRSFGLIGGMMSVLLSGGVLLPIDPTLPPKRQEQMLSEAGVKRLIYAGDRAQASAELPGELSTLPVVFVEAQTGCVVEPARREGGEPPPPLPLPELLPEDPAYIFFTSGSTGVPKGVLGRHKGLSHFLDWQRETFEIGLRDRVAQLSLISFDAMLRDVFLPLTSGATLCLPPEVDGGVATGRTLSWLEREAVTCLHTVPAIAHAWLQDVPAGVSLRSLRHLFLAGEPLHASLVRRWREAFPESGELVNFYGPTETTMIKCFYRVPDDPSPLVQPAGFPLPQTQALVLAEENRLCGIGEVGEIVLRTPFGTLGYINAAGESQRSFVVNPFREDERDVLYRTGDRGRYRLDGSLDILGRIDQQVKVRGVRIELGEVETALVAHPSVSEAAVVALEDASGEARLVAYFVAAHGDNDAGLPEPETLRAFLRERLPEYMIPSTFVSLEAMPLLPNGKVNRKALPAPAPARAARYVAPRTPTEEALAEMWAGLLRVERVGVHDNFFDLGGHSLLATRVVSRVREAFGVEVSLRRVFQRPTVAGLAQAVEELQVEQIGAEALAEMLATLDGLSEGDVESLLGDEGQAD
jgi:amino acid adenylation domain-containing protein